MKEWKEICTLNEIAPGEQAVVRELCATGSMRRRLLDIGLIADTVVECVGRSPCKDPSAYLIRGAVIAIRAEDGRTVRVAGRTRAGSADGRKGGRKWD